MGPAEHETYALEGAGSPDPLGWKLAMALCNLLIALTLLGFVGYLAIETRSLELF
ncbi:hypothetical protein [Enterovirga aerilata]|uniref:Uncharacterized protein n=1 Tax=Enterovirga aerilata TaxID=2730920 RepID=A0A849HUS8_9HYPH|nr:hypothetical protein [Enterovirga sp. DB1703]NNM70862.1 hypothetical protein [Enterovirga sp. DB1703]